MGLGTAPIGHVVTVVGATEFKVDIVASIELEQGYTLQQIQPSIKDSIEEYFLNLRKNWKKADDLNNYSVEIIIARVRSAILNTIGVKNITDCTLNGDTVDIVLTEDSTLQQLPVTGDITING